MGERAGGRGGQRGERLVLLEFVQGDAGHLAVALEFGDVDDAHAAVGGRFLEPVAAFQAVATGLAAKHQVGLAAFDLGPGRDVFGQQGGADHQRNGHHPQHAPQAHAAHARHAQDDELVTLGQAGQRQDRADQQPDGQQVIQAGGNGQRLHVEQGHHGELVAHVVQVVHQREEREKAQQGHKDHCTRAIDLAGQVATCGTHENDGGALNVKA
ncbi:hypothetical protein D3C73_915150 [compost metagenome]